MPKHPSITLKCPAFDEVTGDTCDRDIEVDAWKAEPMTHEYPGSPEGFEITDAPCGHEAVIMKEHYDDIMQQLQDIQVGAIELAAEMRAEAAREDRLLRLAEWDSYGGEAWTTYGS